MARTILADPPPLTPSELRRFPFSVRTFPFDTLQQNAALTRLEILDAAPPTPALDPERLE